MIAAAALARADPGYTTRALLKWHRSLSSIKKTFRIIVF